MGTYNFLQGGLNNNVIRSLFIIGANVKIYLKSKNTPVEGIITEIGSDFIKINDLKIPFGNIDEDKTKNSKHIEILHVIDSFKESVNILSN